MASPSSLFELPTELLEVIIGLIEDPHTLARLALCCKKSTSLIIPHHLHYRAVRYVGPRSAEGFLERHLSVSPRVAAMVHMLEYNGLVEWNPARNETAYLVYRDAVVPASKELGHLKVLGRLTGLRKLSWLSNTHAPPPGFFDDIRRACGLLKEFHFVLNRPVRLGGTVDPALWTSVHTTLLPVWSLQNLTVFRLHLSSLRNGHPEMEGSPPEVTKSVVQMVKLLVDRCPSLERLCVRDPHISPAVLQFLLKATWPELKEVCFLLPVQLGLLQNTSLFTAFWTRHPGIQHVTLLGGFFQLPYNKMQKLRTLRFESRTNPSIDYNALPGLRYLYTPDASTHGTWSVLTCNRTLEALELGAPQVSLPASIPTWVSTKFHELKRLHYPVHIFDSKVRPGALVPGWKEIVNVSKDWKIMLAYLAKFPGLTILTGFSWGGSKNRLLGSMSWDVGALLPHLEVFECRWEELILRQTRTRTSWTSTSVQGFKTEWVEKEPGDGRTNWPALYGAVF